MYFVHAVVIFLTINWTDGRTLHMGPIDEKKFARDMRRLGYVTSKVVGDAVDQVDPGFYVVHERYVDTHEPKIDHLLDSGSSVVTSDVIAKVIEEVDRRFYTYNGLQIGTPLEINYTERVRAPEMCCRALEVLKDHLKPGNKALDIGSSTGYLAVNMALMVGRNGSVVGVSYYREERDNCIENIIDGNPMLLIEERVKFVVCNNYTEGFPRRGPYDAIYAAVPNLNLSQSWLDQLKVGGRLIVPKVFEFFDRPVFTTYDKHPNGTITQITLS